MGCIVETREAKFPPKSHYRHCTAPPKPNIDTGIILCDCVSSQKYLCVTGIQKVLSLSIKIL